MSFHSHTDGAIFLPAPIYANELKGYRRDNDRMNADALRRQLERTKAAAIRLLNQLLPFKLGSVGLASATSLIGLTTMYA